QELRSGGVEIDEQDVGRSLLYPLERGLRHAERGGAVVVLLQHAGEKAAFAVVVAEQHDAVHGSSPRNRRSPDNRVYQKDRSPRFQTRFGGTRAFQPRPSRAISAHLNWRSRQRASFDASGDRSEAPRASRTAKPCA